jgi:hypothetical protein
MRDITFEIPRVGMVRRESKKPKEFSMNFQEEPPKEKSFKLSGALKVVNFSDLTNLLYDLVGL